MLGRLPESGGGDHAYLDHGGRDSFYGFLALHRAQLFRDEDFADLYCAGNGRPSVPPCLLATALLLQTYDRDSDEEAKARADFDLRWKVALGIGLDGITVPLILLANSVVASLSNSRGAECLMS